MEPRRIERTVPLRIDRLARSLLRRAVVVVAALAASLMALPPAASGLQTEPTDQTELADQGLVQLDWVEGGALLFETDEPGWYVPAPTLHTAVDVAISGPIARTTVSQRFRNVADVFVEGKYVFPLPEGASVDTLRMRVGERWIEGTVEGREEAREIYEEARSEGRVASLVEQQRPNVFTTSVANIAPGADVVVQIEYQESLAPRDGVFGLRIPLVVAPRYVPYEQLTHQLELGPDGWVVETILDRDAEAVSSPLVDPRTEDPDIIRNPVEISVDLDAGFPLGPVTSPYHDINVYSRGASSALIDVTGLVPTDRDFYLAWKPGSLPEPYAAAFTEQRPSDNHYIAMVTPPAAAAIGDTRRPREVIFVQDTSGSMSGESIDQAKAGLRMALRRLTPDDSFNIIEFNSYFTTFVDEPVPATPSNIQRSLEFVAGLSADNGTEMRPALEAALADDDPNDGRLRQVIFLTDGAVTNELALLNLIERDLGESRLFTVGIGSAPNSYFMTAAARAGRGSFVFIGDLNEVNDRMQALFAKIETPAVVDLAIEGLPDGAVVSPSPVPDLYAGDPIVLTVRVPAGVVAESMRVTGHRGDDDWHLDISVDDAEQRPGVSKLWAREHIRDLEALRMSAAVDFDERERIDESILATALEFGLVSRLTSLVAVDVEVTRPDGAESASTDVPTNLPSGWDPAVFFDDPSEQLAYGERLVEVSGEALERLAAAGASDQAQGGDQGGVPIPAGGAGWKVRAALGTALVVLGAVAFAAPGGRRRQWRIAPN